jgi:hypothetical protein
MVHGGMERIEFKRDGHACVDPLIWVLRLLKIISSKSVCLMDQRVVRQWGEDTMQTKSSFDLVLITKFMGACI